MRFSLALRVIPRSHADCVDIVDIAASAETTGRALRVRLIAPAADGKANEALIRFLAKTLGVPRSAVTIRRGERSREKLIFIEADSLPEPYLSMARQEK